MYGWYSSFPEFIGVLLNLVELGLGYGPVPFDCNVCHRLIFREHGGRLSSSGTVNATRTCMRNCPWNSLGLFDSSFVALVAQSEGMMPLELPHLIGVTRRAWCKPVPNTRLREALQ